MEGLVYFLTILSLFGSSCSVSNRAFRDLNKKVDLIRTSLEKEIGDLKFEVLDLKSQLESERARADRLEEMLNGTGGLPETDTITVKDVVREEVKALTSQASAGVLAVMQTAFQGEKERARQFESTVTRTISNVSTTTESLNRVIKGLQRTVETICLDYNAQKSDRAIDDIESEITRIDGKVDVSNDTISDLLGAVEGVVDGAQKSARDIKGIQNELTRIRKDADVRDDEIADMIQHDLQLVNVEAKKTTEHVEQVAEQVSEIQRQLSSNRVSFNARISESSRIAFDKGDIIIFPTVTNNAGDGYQKDTGIFTAPIGGKYMFSMTIATALKDQPAIIAQIEHDGRNIGASFANGNAQQQIQGSVTSVVYLDAGDQVWVKIVTPDSGEIWGGYLSSFLGCLIVPY